MLLSYAFFFFAHGFFDDFLLFFILVLFLFLLFIENLLPGIIILSANFHRSLIKLIVFFLELLILGRIDALVATH